MMIFRLILLAAVALLAAGCNTLEKLEPGDSALWQGTGIQLSATPLDGHPVKIGTSSLAISKAAPADAGPSLNRFQLNGLGVDIRSTLATGPVGEQLKAAGGPAALQQLLGQDVARRLDAPEAVFPLPRTDLPKPITDEITAPEPKPKPEDDRPSLFEGVELLSPKTGEPIRIPRFGPDSENP